jgi:hypothetical protein
MSQLLSQALYGQLGADDQTATGKATFGLYVNTLSSVVWEREIYAMRLQNPRDPEGRNVVLSAAAKKVHHKGSSLLLTLIGQVTATLYNNTGTPAASQTFGSAGSITTADLQPFADSVEGATRLSIDSLDVTLLPPACEDTVEVRFLNRYDMPESLTAAYMEEKPSVSDDVSQMYGRRTRFDVRSTTEYTLKSEALHSKSEYDVWQDLLTARKAQVRMHGNWIDVIITKGNYTRHHRHFYGSQVEVSFQTANPYMTI